MRLRILLLVPLVFGPAVAQNLLQNGGFEDSLNCWTPVIKQIQGAHQAKFDTGYQPDSAVLFDSVKPGPTMISTQKETIV